MANEQYITSYLAKCGINVSRETSMKLDVYYKRLVEKNKFLNLTAITEFEEAVQKHFADSLAPLSEFNEGETSNVSRETFYQDGVSIVDVGTGAGFPGLPLKIVLPGAKVTLIDALRKRLDFLDEVIEELELKDVWTVHARAEEAARDEELRENFDICVSRAVADLAILSEYCLPFVKVGGILVSYKAYDCEEELEGAKKAIETLGGKVESIETFALAESDIKRKLIIIRKISSTDDKYPRRAGKPEKKPIK